MQASLAALNYSSSPKDYDRAFVNISIVVIALHLVFMTWAALTAPQKNIPLKPVERIVVKTINLNPVQKTKVTSSSNAKEMAPVTIPPLSEIPLEKSVPSETAPKIEVAMPEPQVELIPVPEPLEEKHQAKAKPKPLPPIEIVKPTPSPLKKEVPKKKSAEKKIPKKDSPKKEVPKKEPPKKDPPKKEPIQNKDKHVEKPISKQPEKSKVDFQMEAAKVKQKELLAKAQQNIAKIDQSRGKIASTKGSDILAFAAAPGRIDSLQIDALPSLEGAPLNSHEIGYRDELASRLKLLLKLPDHGEVKVKLTLERSGKVVKLAIVNSKSNSNREYIEKKLPSMTFPAFGNNFEGLNQYTFLISLSNEL